MSSARVECDVAIIGAGPSGLYASYYAGFRGLTTAVIDSLPELGGQISAMYPEKPIYDVAGFPAIKGKDLVAGLAEQASRFSPRYLLGQQALALNRRDADTLEIVTDQDVVVESRAVIIAGGIGVFKPRPFAAGQAWHGRGVVHFVKDLETYRGQDALVIGGGDSALDWALGLEPIARSVTLVHRRSTFRAHAHSVKELNASTVRVFTDAEVIGVSGGAVVQQAEISVQGGEPVRVGAQAIVAALGFTANLGPMLDWGLDIVDRRHVGVDTAMSTNMTGVYAVGDITDYPGKVRLISVGFGEAAIAVNNAAVLINPDTDLFPGHSSDFAPTTA